MADKRTKDLDPLLVAELQALINTLSLPSDDSSFAEAKKILWTNLLFNSAVGDTSAEHPNHVAMTPNSFYASVMTPLVFGVGKSAASGDVATKFGTGLLSSQDQALMQPQWARDWWENNGVPNQIQANSFTAPRAMQFTSCFFNTITASTSIAISPVLPTNYRYKSIYFTWVVGFAGISGTAMGNNKGSGTLNYTGGTESYILASIAGGSDLDLRLSADGREISVYAPNSAASLGVELSISFNVILESF